MPDAPRPRVLITRLEDDSGERWEDYADRVRAAGGDPFPFDVAEYRARDEFPPHDGLVLTGGADIDPARYGEPPHERLGTLVPARDEAEIALARTALAIGRPMLAICRGMQVMNVASGGSLHQHLEEREPHRSRRGADGVSIDSGWHGVEVTNGTLLSQIAKAAGLRVNSRHHQAVTRARLAPGLVASALTLEGGFEVVEAIEAPHHPFALGVQWHPERAEMAATPALAAGSGVLFEAFLGACAASTATPARAFLYFGYGSSMDAERLRQTAPRAWLIGPARLSDHALAFSIESKNTWHGGVADIVPAPGDEVWGALWLIPAEESHALDEHEGLFREPPAYRRMTVEVTTTSGDRVRCRSYQVASPDPRTPPPSKAFKDTLLRGARTVGLPQSYVARLAAIEDNGRA